MKNLFLIILVFLSLFLVSCGKLDSDSKSGNNSDDEPFKMRFLPDKISGDFPDSLDTSNKKSFSVFSKSGMNKAVGDLCYAAPYLKELLEKYIQTRGAEAVVYSMLADKAIYEEELSPNGKSYDVSIELTKEMLETAALNYTDYNFEAWDDFESDFTITYSEQTGDYDYLVNVGVHYDDGELNSWNKVYWSKDKTRIKIVQPIWNTDLSAEIGSLTFSYDSSKKLTRFIFNITFDDGTVIDEVINFIEEGEGSLYYYARKQTQPMVDEFASESYNRIDFSRYTGYADNNGGYCKERDRSWYSRSSSYSFTEDNQCTFNASAIITGEADEGDYYTVYNSNLSLIQAIPDYTWEELL